MAEWFKAHAWKACSPKGVRGSNPRPSAILLRASRFAGFAPPSGAKQDALRSFSEEGLHMHYVYLLESGKVRGQRYVGLTTGLKRRLVEHNAGKSPHASKFVPWRLVTYVAFTDERKAAAFERYLKSGSGHAFANRRLW